MKKGRFLSVGMMFLTIFVGWGMGSAAWGEFVGGVETFAGTVKDTGTWEEYVGYIGGGVSQNDKLTMDGYTAPAGNVDYTTTTVRVGVGQKVSVEMTPVALYGGYPVMVLSLTNNSGGSASRLAEDTQRYDISWHKFYNGVFAYGVGVPWTQVAPITTVGTKIIMSIERTSATSATFSVHDVNNNLLGSLSLTGLPAFVGGDPYIGLALNASLTDWDNVVAGAEGPPADCAVAVALGYGLASDLNEDCRVDAGDVGVLAGEWQNCNDPTNVDCVATVPPDRGWVVEAGWDMPDAQWVHDQVLAMEQKPFHGLVLDLGRRYPATTNTFAWFAWNKLAFTSDMQQRVAEDVVWLEETGFRRFREKSFLFVECSGVTPTPESRPDWFDADFGVVTDRMEEVAGYVQQLDFAGICIDTEQYQWKLWNYAEQKLRSTKSFAEYEQQVRLRGQEIGTAIRAGCPGRPITLFFFIGNSSAANQVGSNRAALPGAYYGLLPAFMDGLLDVADADMRLIDGVELCYGAHEPSYFDWAVGLYQNGVQLSSDPARYAQKVGMGLGTMLDYRSADWGGWHTTPGTLDQNYHSPSEYQWAIAESIRRAELTWVWSQIPNWWTGASLPQAYMDAMVNATGLPGALNTCEGVLAVEEPMVGDLNGDCYVNLGDFAKVAGDWLRCNDPEIASCEEPWL